MSDHETWRESAAAYVLGALDPVERAGFEAHLRECERCREEVVALSPLPGLLARVDPEDVEDAVPAGPPVDAVVAAVREEVAGVERSRRRWRLLASAAAACVVVLGAIAVGQAMGDDATSDDDHDRGVELALAASSDVTGAIVADERAWGTYVHVSLRDLPEAEGYELWVVDTDGGWHVAGTWAPTPTGAADLGGSSELALDQIDRIVVTSTGRGEELVVAS